MKRLTALILICFLAASAVFAVDLNFTSLTSQATFGLFLNELDAAASANETSKGPGFSELENNYFFGGISSNIEKITDGSTTSTFVTGYYSASARPWSVFAYVDMSGADQAAAMVESQDVYNVAGEKVSTTSEVPSYDQINTQLQFLMNFGDINTGLKMLMSFEDLTDPLANYSEKSNVTGSAYDNTYEDMNGSNYGMTFIVPAFYDMGNMKHYGGLYFGFTNTDDSTLLDEENITAATTLKQDTTDTSGTSNYGLFYELTMPLGPGELTPYTLLGFNGMSSDYSYKEDNNGVKTSVSTSTSYKNGFDFDLGARYLMNMKPAGDWLMFRMQPAVQYSYSSDAYETGSKTKTTVAGVTSDTSTKKALDKTWSNTLFLRLDSAVEMKPENWFFGFQMGSRITLQRSREMNEFRNPDTVDALGVVTENKDTTTTVNETLWDSTVSMRYGFFVPLPDDYRLDFTLNGSNLLNFESISVQLIVPLN